jgi:CRP-like cAMP-binding protein
VTDVVDALANIHLFRGLKPEGLQRIAEIASEETFARNTVIFREGEEGDKLYLLALAVLGPGDAFGEMSLVDDFPRSADARVHEKCRCLVLSREAMEDLLFLDKDLAYEFLWNTVKVLSARLRETNDKMTFLSTSGKF